MGVDGDVFPISLVPFLCLTPSLLGGTRNVFCPSFCRLCLIRSVCFAAVCLATCLSVCVRVSVFLSVFVFLFFCLYRCDGEVANLQKNMLHVSVK